MKFKKDADPIATSDFWYDLTDGGYIKPEELLEDISDIEKVKRSVNILMDFKWSLETAGLIEEM